MTRLSSARAPVSGFPRVAASSCTRTVRIRSFSRVPSVLRVPSLRYDTEHRPDRQNIVLTVRTSSLSSGHCSAPTGEEDPDDGVAVERLLHDATLECPRTGKRVPPRRSLVLHENSSHPYLLACS